jgi:lysophospholipase L1-like esterase
VTLIVLELLLQRFLDPARLYSAVHVVPALNQWKQEVDFWSRYREHNMVFLNHDPMLGWDFDRGQDRIRGSRVVSEEPPEDELRIVAIGDSFTYGVDVQPHETYSAVLDDIAGVQALNMGVPGYGIDQAFLKFQQFGRRYQPDVVVFGIYVSDYERSSIGFTASAKPRFYLQDGHLSVEGQPVATPAQEFERIDRALADKIYLFEGVRNLWRKVLVADSDTSRFFTETDKVVRHILASLQHDLNDEQTLIVIHIPRAEAFLEPHKFRDEMSRRLLSIYAALGILYIDLTTELVTDRDATAAFEQYYVHRDDGSVGHLSADGHSRVAQLIRQALAEQAVLLRGP